MGRSKAVSVGVKSGENLIFRKFIFFSNFKIKRYKIRLKDPFCDRKYGFDRARRGCTYSW